VDIKVEAQVAEPPLASSLGLLGSDFCWPWYFLRGAEASMGRFLAPMLEGLA
jgi:hypothetical protein